MQFFNSSVARMVGDVAGDYADDFDIDAIVRDYVDAFNATLESVGVMASLHADGSVTEWDWADTSGWDERTPLTRDVLDMAADSVDLMPIMERHDTKARKRRSPRTRHYYGFDWTRGIGTWWDDEHGGLPIGDLEVFDTRDARNKWVMRGATRTVMDAHTAMSVMRSEIDTWGREPWSEWSTNDVVAAYREATGKVA